MTHIYRKDSIVELCKDKSVLHLGFIQHGHLYKNLMKEDNWLHAKIEKVSEKLVGIDFLEKDILWFRENTSYEVYSVDVTKLETWKYQYEFDIIVCGELIEHLGNPGLMLNGLKRFMHQGTLLIVTTPNPWSRNRLRLISKGIPEAMWVNPEHTCWFSYQTLKQLLDRYGFKESEYNYYVGETKNEVFPVKRKWLLPFALLKQFYLKHRVPKRKSTGLFFCATLK